jgi:glycerol uptake facilitator-like aquaporin
MMTLLARVVFVILTAIAALHAYWAFGGLWPGSDTRSLIDTVIGDPRLNALPPAWMFAIVITLIFMSGVFAVAAVRKTEGLARFFVKTGVAVIAFVFLARGVAGYAMSKSMSDRLSEPFATYDQLLYSPLCLVLGAAFVTLFFARGARP